MFIKSSLRINPHIRGVFLFVFEKIAVKGFSYNFQIDFLHYSDFILIMLSNSIRNIKFE